MNSNFIGTVLIAGGLFAAVGVGWAIKNWDLFCESVELLPVNLKRLAEWHKRRALRRWWKLLNFIGRENNEY